MPYDDYEREKLQLFYEEVKKNKVDLPINWKESDSLRIVYVSKFKPKNFIKNLKANLQWRETPLNHQPSDMNLAFLAKGIIYTCGRDYQCRPVIIMNLELVNLKQFS